MSFIRNYIETLSRDHRSFLQEIPLLLERRFLFDNLSKMEPKKIKRFNDFVELIKLHMPKLVKDSFTPEHLKPKQNMSSWDEFILSPFEPRDSLYEEVDTLSKDFIAESKQNKINNRKFNKFKEKIIEFLEVGSVKAGLNTALANIWGLLRVIPILVKNQTGDLIDKAKFISILKGKNTQTLLRKIMSMNIFAMNGLFNILHQKPVSTKEEALQTLFKLTKDT
ncbi:hypothetical protein E3A20_15460 [Planctomyces bekefii]|uniref:Uncharacterized protein n=1 Tax=Planctomyces bekefii TaxID=1653850 RepID=A0A5C6M8G8_9PLAN|nr:hypothetical protein E3A20_15460 [Planctomyces bekefii]